MYFSMFFDVDESILEDYGALNISLINDMPLFIDPFLLFNSDKREYNKLHDDIISYLAFLRDESQKDLSDGLIKRWFYFSEIKENWLGFSEAGNSGSGLGKEFAHALKRNLSNLFNDFSDERITKGSHLEKLCLIRDGVGRDNISDFTTNLIHEFLLDYTSKFADDYIEEEKKEVFHVNRVRFNYETRSWMNKTYKLPKYNNDYILLTPKDILTKDDTWINKSDMISQFHDIASSMSDSELRAQLSDYISTRLSKKMTDKEKHRVYASAILNNPKYIDFFIKYKEDNGDKAEILSKDKVALIEKILIENIDIVVKKLKETDFNNTGYASYEETFNRIRYLKDVIEKNDGYQLFYHDKKPINQEKQLQLIFRFIWYNSDFDVNREVNNGRGPVDYKISKGFSNSTLVEFKLAKNSKLKQNLQNQVEIYKDANKTKNAIKVIIFFTKEEEKRVYRILEEIEQIDNENIVLIDARADNKASASTVK